MMNGQPLEIEVRLREPSARRYDKAVNTMLGVSSGAAVGTALIALGEAALPMAAILGSVVAGPLIGGVVGAAVGAGLGALLSRRGERSEPSDADDRTEAGPGRD